MSHTDHIEFEIRRTRDRLGRHLDALEAKLSIANLLEDAMRFFEHGNGNVGRTLRHNALPLTVAAVGLGWLAASAFRNRSTHEHGSNPYDQHTDVRTPEGGDRYDRPAEPVGEAASAAGDAHDPAQRWSRSARDFVDEARHQAEETYDEARRRAEDAGHRVGDAASRVRHAASATADNVARSARAAGRGAASAGRSAAQFAERNPFATAAICFGVGAAAGVLLSSTRTERRLVGKQAKAFKREMSARARDLRERAEREGRAFATQAADYGRGRADEALRKAEDAADRGHEAIKEAAEALRSRVGDQEAEDSAATAQAKGKSAKRQSASRTNRSAAS